MSKIIAKSIGVNISPRKLRILSDIVSGAPVAQALTNLQILPQKGAKVIVKVLKNALNIADSKNLPVENLKITAFQIDDGPRTKRWLPAPRGRSYKITKRSAHITITLSNEKGKQ